MEVEGGGGREGREGREVEVEGGENEEVTEHFVYHSMQYGLRRGRTSSRAAWTQEG